MRRRPERIGRAGERIAKSEVEYDLQALWRAAGNLGVKCEHLVEVLDSRSDWKEIQSLRKVRQILEGAGQELARVSIAVERRRDVGWAEDLGPLVHVASADSRCICCTRRGRHGDSSS